MKVRATVDYSVYVEVDVFGMTVDQAREAIKKEADLLFDFSSSVAIITEVEKSSGTPYVSAEVSYAEDEFVDSLKE